MGKFNPEITSIPWMDRRDRLWPIVQESLKYLMQNYEQIVIEGAGSPAEINLRAVTS